MRLLVLGGTVFLGRHAVTAARARGHDVTIFHRGRHPLEAGEDIEVVHGDRRNDLDRLADRRWDAVLDTSGYLPSDVAASADALARRVDRYVFVSSISAYADVAAVGLTEEAKLAELSEADRREAESMPREGLTQSPRFGELYGALKIACEEEVVRAAGDRALIVRPGLIVGPLDPTDRFTYWPERVERGGDVLLGGRPGRPVQFIDVRDLAEWMVRAIEGGRRDVFHVTGAPDTVTMADVFETSRSIAESDARPVWCDEAFLLEQGVSPWMELPLWIPETDLAMAGFMRVDVRRAIAAGLTFRPLADTARATLDWASTRPPGPRRAGLAPEREATLLERWAQRQGATPRA